MAKYRPPEYCLQCGKQLTPIYRDQSNLPLMQRIIGDTFMGYKPCECSVKLPIKTEGESSQVTYAAVSPVYKNLVEGWYEDAKGTPFQIIKLSAPPSPIKTEGEDEITGETTVLELDEILHEFYTTNKMGKEAGYGRQVLQKLVLSVCDAQRKIRQSSGSKPPSPAGIDVEALKKIKDAFQWTWDHIGEPHTSDHFNIPANGIHAIERLIYENAPKELPQSSTGGLPKLDQPILDEDDVKGIIESSTEEEKEQCKHEYGTGWRCIHCEGGTPREGQIIKQSKK